MSTIVRNLVNILYVVIEKSMFFLGLSLMVSGYLNPIDKSTAVVPIILFILNIEYVLVLKKPCQFETSRWCYALIHFL